MSLHPVSPEKTPDIARAVAVLRGGGLVAFPTETVYGLGADAGNPEAVAKVFKAKGRPADHPLIVHLADASWLPRCASDIPPAAWRLAEHFWPGPLTLILKRNASVPDAVTGGQDTVGLRVPTHPVARALLEAFGGGLAAPSANRFGRVSPTRAEHVRTELGDVVDMILDGGACTVGIESTIVSFAQEKPLLLRYGAIAVASIEAVLGHPLERAGNLAGLPRAPGSHDSHYAPATPITLLDATALWAEATRAAPNEHIAVMPLSQPDGELPTEVVVFAMPCSAEDYARQLYAVLRDADQAGCTRLLVERPPAEPDWLAVHDRLNRAASR